MPHRVAIASSDGKFIDLHFGQAGRFIVVDVDEAGYAVMETRKCSPACACAAGEKNGFDSIASLLRDCEAVFVSRIGPAAAQAMSPKGIRVFEAPYFIEDVLNRVVNEKLLEADGKSPQLPHGIPPS
jgi:predicted Fe-Mo cluster-binding NifX family protein